jgi:hypothetical protein
MTAALPLFRESGILWRAVADGIPDGAPTAVMRAILKATRNRDRGIITDRELVELVNENRPEGGRPRSTSYIQRGLRYLQSVGLIVRERIGQHGRRLIQLVLPLRGRKPASPKPKSAAPVAAKKFVHALVKTGSTHCADLSNTLKGEKELVERAADADSPSGSSPAASGEPGAGPRGEAPAGDVPSPPAAAPDPAPDDPAAAAALLRELTGRPVPRPAPRPQPPRPAAPAGRGIIHPMPRLKKSPEELEAEKGRQLRALEAHRIRLAQAVPAAPALAPAVADSPAAAPEAGPPAGAISDPEKPAGFLRRLIHRLRE